MTSVPAPLRSEPSRGLYIGTRPTALRVEFLSNRVRLRIETPGDPAAPIVDLTDAEVDDLVSTLRERYDS